MRIPIGPYEITIGKKVQPPKLDTGIRIESVMGNPGFHCLNVSWLGEATTLKIPEAILDASGNRELVIKMEIRDALLNHAGHAVNACLDWIWKKE